MFSFIIPHAKMSSENDFIIPAENSQKFTLFTIIKWYFFLIIIMCVQSYSCAIKVSSPSSDIPVTFLCNTLCWNKKTIFNIVNHVEENIQDEHETQPLESFLIFLDFFITFFSSSFFFILKISHIQISQQVDLWLPMWNHKFIQHYVFLCCFFF